MSRVLEKAIGPLILLIGTVPLSAQPPRVVQSPRGDSALTLVETTSGYRLEDRAGRVEPLALPAGARLSTVAELKDGWVVAGEMPLADGAELVVLTDEAGERTVLAAPEGRFGSRRLPVPLVQEGRLVGLAWLEGDGGEKNAVAAARRTAVGWEAVEHPAPFVGEAQLGLTGTVLADGSWLLLWAAVDDEDDEVLWSRLTGETWSPPARLHEDNAVPDITPAVTSVAGGAVAAWSRFDGKDYRLRLARFDGSSWLDLGFVGGEGSVFPTVFPTADGAGFLFSTVRPSQWTVIEVDADGRVQRSLGLAPHLSRPIVLATSPEAVNLRFLAMEAPSDLTTGASEEHRLEWDDPR